MRLTEQGQKVAVAIASGQYIGIAGADDGIERFKCWTEEFAYYTARILGVDRAAVGGIIAGLTDAGLLDANGETTGLTEAGRAYCAALGLAYRR